MDCWGNSVSWGDRKAAPPLFSRSICPVSVLSWGSLNRLAGILLTSSAGSLPDGVHGTEDTDRIAPQPASGLWGGHSGSWVCRALSCPPVPHQGCLWPCCTAPLHLSQEEWTPCQDYTCRTSDLYYPKPQNIMFTCFCFNLNYAISILQGFIM